MYSCDLPFLQKTIEWMCMYERIKWPDRGFTTVFYIIRVQIVLSPELDEMIKQYRYMV